MNIIFIMEEFENSKISSITIITYFFNDSSEYLLKWIKNIKEVFSIKEGNFIIFTPYVFKEYENDSSIEFIHYPNYQSIQKLYLSLFSWILTLTIKTDFVFFISPNYLFHKKIELPLSKNLIYSFSINNHILTDFFGSSNDHFFNLLLTIHHSYISYKIKEDYSILDYHTFHLNYILHSHLPKYILSIQDYIISSSLIHKTLFDDDFLKKSLDLSDPSKDGSKKDDISIKMYQNITPSYKYVIMHTCGGLGNVFFQIATCISLAIEYNRIPCFIFNPNHKDVYNKSCTYRSSHFRYHLFDKVPMIHIDDLNDSNIVYSESNFNYQPEIHTFIKNHQEENMIQCKGYYQSTPYFSKHISKMIQDYFQNNILQIKTEYYLNQWKEKYNPTHKRLISIHVRGGDYIQHSYFHLCLSKMYYKNCLKEIFSRYPED